MTGRVVLLAPRGVTDEATVAGLGDARRLRLVCWAGAPTAGLTAVQLPRPSKRVWRLHAALGRGPLGRTLVRLTPADTGALFWRAASRHAEVEAAVHGADLVVAGERDAVYAAWRMLNDRSRGVRGAVNGIAAAAERVNA
ncbi:hypothetical protein [Microbacterium sp. JZ31]|uniref:hypothetical protein n=1 Tax=Microbacterium sp. JZ31 TaxID=1906274 RepID=UPI0019319994|nr:hypothetical protein [Microbacterium sp. JZ31]